ncbi:MAG: CbtA family protein [Sphingomonas sp.]
MVGPLLWRGMLAGLLGAVLAALFALAFAEPQVDLAIAVEAAHSAHDGMHAEPEIVSRATQKGTGLFTALILYGTAVGGLFALLFAAGYGRVGGRTGPIGPRALALLLALAAFVIVALVPALKYPPTPPAVGRHETVAVRTIAYFGMIGLSLLAAVAGGWARRRLLPRRDGFDALVGGLLAYVAVVSVVQALLPAIDEVPADFPATLLWRFRLASLGSQLVLWLALGLVFGRLAERLLAARRHA